LMRTGDVIIGFNDTPVGSVDDLYLLLSDAFIGKAISITLLRKGVSQTVTAIPAEAA